ncbi:MAG: amino acid permease [Armatimonadota bacterium]
MAENNNPKPHYLGVFVLAMMNVAIVMNLRGLPMMAKEGLSMIFYLLFAAFIFLIPVALVSAELATGWSDGGGVFRWVKEAFGGRMGFLAIWLQWIQNVIWYPTVLAFVAAALSYMFLDPALATNKIYNIAIILLAFWGATLLNFRGIKTSGWVTTVCVMGGTIFPGAVIIILGLIWWLTGKPIAFTGTHQSIIPNLSNFTNISFLAGIVLLFAGMEVSAVHAREVKNPNKDFPKAIFLAVIIILTIFTFSSLAIAAVLPAGKISLTAGIMQAFKDMLNQFHMGWLVPIMCFLVAFGALGSVTAWIVGPSKGLLSTAQDGDLPPFLQYTNNQGVPVHILILQALIVTVLSLVYLLMPTVSSAFFLLTALTAILYLIMYLMLFAAAITLRYTKPDVPRAYKVPGGNFGMWVISAVGILGALFAIVVGFFPPAQLTVGSPAFYVWFLIIGILLFTLSPIIIYQLRKPGWQNKTQN